MLSYDPPTPLKGQDPTPATALSSSIKGGGGATKDAPFKPVTAGIVAPTMDQTQKSDYTHIFLVTGPAGCGKTTVAECLAESLKMPYIEGDSFHTPANIEKMRNGIPLTDADRWDWLTLLREESIRQINAGSSGVILTCSALKRKYRDVIRVAAYYDHHLLIHFIYLDAPKEVLVQRVMQRQGHYMGANMVRSQLDILEVPCPEERDVITIDVSRDIDEVMAVALDRVSQIMSHDGRQ